MEPEAIRRTLHEYLYEKFQPVVLILTNGSRHTIATIEHVSVADDIVHVVDRKGDSVLIGPGHVAEIRPIGKPRRNGRGARS